MCTMHKCLWVAFSASSPCSGLYTQSLLPLLKPSSARPLRPAHCPAHKLPSLCSRPHVHDPLALLIASCAFPRRFTHVIPLSLLMASHKQPLALLKASHIAHAPCVALSAQGPQSISTPHVMHVRPALPSLSAQGPHVHLVLLEV